MNTEILKDIKIVWACRFHPTDWFHEVGCGHENWSNEQLQSALETSKKSQAYQLQLLIAQRAQAFEEALEVIKKSCSIFPEFFCGECLLIEKAILSLKNKS